MTGKTKKEWLGGNFLHLNENLVLFNHAEWFLRSKEIVEKAVSMGTYFQGYLLH